MHREPEAIVTRAGAEQDARRRRPLRLHERRNAAYHLELVENQCIGRCRGPPASLSQIDTPISHLLQIDASRDSRSIRSVTERIARCQARAGEQPVKRGIDAVHSCHGTRRRCGQCVANTARTDPRRRHELSASSLAATAIRYRKLILLHATICPTPDIGGACGVAVAGILGECERARIHRARDFRGLRADFEMTVGAEGVVEGGVQLPRFRATVLAVAAVRGAGQRERAECTS